MKRFFGLILGLFVIVSGAMPLLASGTVPKCATKNPIVLVHGAFFKDENMLGINYWWGIVDALEDEGGVVYVTQQDTFDSPAERAVQVAREIGEFLAVHPEYKKVNIIGHSQGPLDSRYMIANLNIPGKGPAKDYVATLTSISGTHLGSEVANLLWSLYTGIPILGEALGDFIVAAVNGFASVFYYNEENQDCMDTLYCLTTDFVTDIFNPNTPNASGVYYQSWAGKIKGIGLNIDNLIVGPLWTIMNLMGAGDNDCLVSVESAKWGNWRGTLTGAWWSDGVSHFNEIGHFFGDTPGFDAPEFYVDVVDELRKKGY